MLSRRSVAGLGIAAYFALASWAKFSYVDPTPLGNCVTQLFWPFTHERGYAWSAGEQPTTPCKNDFIVYEDNHPLAPADNFSGLSETPGEFLHDGPRILISARGDPNHNGKRYWLVTPGQN